MADAGPAHDGPLGRILTVGVLVSLVLGASTWFLIGSFFDDQAAGPTEPIRPPGFPDRPDWLPSASICAMTVVIVALILTVTYAAAMTAHNRTAVKKGAPE